jgi:flagellar motor switch protein FliN/FliY
MGEDELINQDEIEALLQQASSADSAKPASAASQQQKEAPAAAIDQSEIEALLAGGSAPAAKAPGKAAAAEAVASEVSAPAAAVEPKAVAEVSAADADARDAEDSDKLLAQDDIERLLNQAGKTPASPKREPAVVSQGRISTSSFPGEGDMPSGDIEYLLTQAEEALRSARDGMTEVPNGVLAFRLPELGGAPANTENATIDLISDVELDLKIELGRTNMYLEDVLKLRKGSVVPLDKLAGDPVDIFVNGRLIARGEVLVLNDNFCVRVAELIAGVNPEMV